MEMKNMEHSPPSYSIYNQNTNRQSLLSQNIKDSHSSTIQMQSLGESFWGSGKKSNRDSFVQGTFLRKKRTTIKITVLNDSFNANTEVKDNDKSFRQIDDDNKNIKKGGDPDYDIWDLTFTIISSKIPIVFSAVFFTIFVLIRYYTFACLIYITSLTSGQNVLWILVVVANRVVYMILVIKISLKAPQTHTEIVLKSHWNSKQSTESQYFQITDSKKLFTSIVRGLVPAELAFLYIKAAPRKRFLLYTAINYINSSIQAVLYYPFFIAYGSLLVIYGQSFGLDIYYKNSTLGVVVFAQFVITVVTIVLLGVGLKRKYGSFCCCWWK